MAAILDIFYISIPPPPCQKEGRLMDTIEETTSLVYLAQARNIEYFIFERQKTLTSYIMSCQRPIKF